MTASPSCSPTELAAAPLDDDFNDAGIANNDDDDEDNDDHEAETTQRKKAKVDDPERARQNSLQSETPFPLVACSQVGQV
jgi:hypothetical protein